MTEMNKLKDDVKSKNNPYVNDVLARGQWIKFLQYIFILYFMFIFSLFVFELVHITVYW
jgi:hypothetical protein